MNFKLLSVLALVSFVSAQEPSGTDAVPSGTDAVPTGSGPAGPSPTGIPPCVATCIQTTAPQFNCALDDETCLCGSDFLTTTAQCVQTGCSPDIASVFPAAAQQACAGAGASSSAVPSAVPSSAPVTGSATTAGTAVTRPVSSTIASVSRPITPTSTRTASGTGAASTTNAAAPIVAQGAWAMAAGVLGLAVAL